MENKGIAGTLSKAKEESRSPRGVSSIGNDATEGGGVDMGGRGDADDAVWLSVRSEDEEELLPSSWVTSGGGTVRVGGGGSERTGTCWGTP